MLYYLATADNRDTMDSYLSHLGKSCRDFIQVIPYESFLLKKKFPAGIYLFSDIELLSAEQRSKILHIWERLNKNKNDYLLWNHPTRSMQRVELLQTLHEKGENIFTVYRLKDFKNVQQFPVFIRKDNDHGGSKTQLIHTADELAKNVDDITKKHTDLKNWIITEYVDVSDAEGFFKKYSAILMNDTITPRHVFFSKKWVQKKDDLRNDNYDKEELEFIATNPHEKQIKQVFKLANIDYGRIDYGFKDGKLQVWEINTNPFICQILKAKREKVNQAFNDKFLIVMNQVRQHPLAQKKDGNILARLDSRLHVLYEKLKLTAVMKPCYKFFRHCRHLIFKNIIWKIKPLLSRS